MTMITIIVVVALIFFATMCVLALNIWKRETRRRTDTIEDLKANLENLEYSLMELSRSNTGSSNQYQEEYSQPEAYQQPEGYPQQPEPQPQLDVWQQPEPQPQPEFQFQPEDVAEPFSMQQPIGQAVEPEPAFPPQQPEDSFQDLQSSIDADLERVQTIIENQPPPEKEIHYAEINLDFDDLGLGEEPAEGGYADPGMIVQQEPEAMNREGIEDIDILDDQEDDMDFQIGRSGKTYTAIELETLIKE